MPGNELEDDLQGDGECVSVEVRLGLWVVEKLLQLQTATTYNAKE